MLQCKNIIKDYVSGDEIVHALKGVSLSFREHEFVSILGQSGCGKTTFLNIIGGLDHYTSGDHSGCVCILRWRSGYFTGRTGAYVHHHSKGICQYGVGNSHWDSVLCTGAVRSSYQLYCPDGERCIYLPGRTEMAQKESNRYCWCDHDSSWNSFFPWIWTAWLCKNHWNAVSGFL